MIEETVRRLDEIYAEVTAALLRLCHPDAEMTPSSGADPSSRGGSDRPKADYVGHPAMDAGSYRVERDGPFTRPGLDGVWVKRMEFWTEGERQCGAWRWERSL